MHSNSKKAKGIIRNEIRAYYSPNAKGGGRSTLANMKADAEAAYWPGGVPNTDYHKGANLVDGGSFGCYYDDQRKMLGKIYGRKKVKSWSGDKTHNTYKHLIGREYAAMMREQKNRKPARKGRR